MRPTPLATSTLRLTGIACVLALLAACAASLEDVIAEHRPAVQEVFDKIEALTGPAHNAAPLSEDGMDVGDARILLDGDDSNALFIRADDLASPEHASGTGMGGTHALAVQYCGEALRNDFDGAAAGAASFMQECGRAKYVFVLRTQREEMAQLIDNESFQPGLYEGEVLLFRLADGALLGGFRVSARSSDEIETTTDSSGTPIDAIERLNSDLSSQVYVDINDKLKAHIPGVVE